MTPGWKIVVVASLILNLFLGGAAVGVLVVGARVLGERSEFRRSGENPRVFGALQALPPERRQKLREILRGEALDAQDDYLQARQARQEATRLMTAERYDPAAVTAALAKAREADGRVRTRLDSTLAARLTELSPEERAVFSRMLMRGGGRGGGGRMGGPDGRRGGPLGPGMLGGPPPAAPAKPN